jgi:hypothetical protein
MKDTKTYIPNKPCIRGHLLRYEVSRECVECMKLRAAKHYEKNAKIMIARSVTWAQKNPEHVRNKLQKYYIDNKEKARLRMQRWFRENRARAYALNAKHRYRARNTPCWLTEDDLKEIKNLFDEAKQYTRVTGIKHVVDHEIPLRGKLVSGLTVPTNLRIITHTENSRKKNKYVV